jgi:hypothetical protein
MSKLAFRHSFPQLCEPTKTIPLDFSGIKDIVEVIPVKRASLPYGWVNLRDPSTYIHPVPSVNELACNVIKNMRAKWMKWDFEHEIFVDYDKVEIYNEYDEDSESEVSIECEDPEDYKSE